MFLMDHFVRLIERLPLKFNSSVSQEAQQAFLFCPQPSGPRYTRLTERKT